jgi:hypothetical protein
MVALVHGVKGKLVKFDLNNVAVHSVIRRDRSVNVLPLLQLSFQIRAATIRIGILISGN